MSIVNSIATASTTISMNNAKQNIGISVLKKSMQQSEENMSKILSMNVSPAPSGTTVDHIV